MMRSMARMVLILPQKWLPKPGGRKGFAPVPAQVHVTLCLDPDVLAWFKAQGEAYQGLINTALRAYAARKHQAPEP
jgi:uncharacterized protein (DUF4415 family)